MKHIVSDSFVIAIKELKQLSRDPISLVLTIMFPILLIEIFIVISTAFSAPSYNIPVVVADLDGSYISKLLVDEMTRSSIVTVSQIYQIEEKALYYVELGKAAGAVVIPKGFGDMLLNQGESFIVLQTDNSKIVAKLLIQSSVSSYAQNLINLVGSRFGIIPESIEIISRPLSGRPPSGDPILPGMLGMIIILGAFDDIVNAVARERELGTFTRLALSPISILSIYTGKMLLTVIVNAVRTTFMLLIFTLTGVVIRGNLLLIYLMTSLIALFTMSLGLLLSSRIRSSSTLTILEIAITFPLFQLAGSTDSVVLLASGGRTIARMLPWTYGNEALRRIIYLGMGFEAILNPILILSISTILILPIATILSERTI